jgi:endonuclease-8
MSEGPQVKLTTERLAKYLLRKKVTACKTTRPGLVEFAERARGRHITDVFCKGKHIFVRFEQDVFLHNHLLMRGKWRRVDGRLLLLPDELWLALEVDNSSVCNYRGQLLKVLTAEQVTAQLKSLGPDVMAATCSPDEIAAALQASDEAVGVTLLDQSVLSGVGNVSKSESLFAARIHPESKANSLDDAALHRLACSIKRLLWDSYRAGGQWTQQVYRRAGMRCFLCGSKVRMIRQGAAQRSTYFCPSCQRT